MQTLSAKGAKNGFGRLIDIVFAEPVAVAKHGQSVVVVMAVKTMGDKTTICNGDADRRLRKTQ